MFRKLRVNRLKVKEAGIIAEISHCDMYSRYDFYIWEIKCLRRKLAEVQEKIRQLEIKK